MRSPARMTLAALAMLLVGAQDSESQTFSLAPGSPTVPVPGAACGPVFSPAGDILGPGAVSIVPMGPPGCGLGWPGPPGDVDAFSSGLFPLPAGPLPAGIALKIGVDALASGDAGGCAPLVPGFFPPDVGSEAAGLSDAAADVFDVCFGGLGCPPAPPMMPALAPYAMPNFQISDGNGAPAPPFLLPPGPPALGPLVEPAPPGDDVDALDFPAAGAWSAPPGVPMVPVYFSVDPPTAFGAGFLPSDVIVTGGGFLAGVYAAPPALGLDLIGGPGSDDLDALIVFDADGAPLVFTPAAGDVVLFSVTAASAIVGAPNPCPGPLLGYPLGPGDILTEGTTLGAPGAACVMVPAVNMELWSGTAIGCLPNPFGAIDDNLDTLDVGPPFGPPATPTPTATATFTPAGPPTATPTTTTTATFTPGGPPTATPTPTATFTPGGPPTATPTPGGPTATPTTTPTPTCAALPVAGCRTPSVGQKAQLALKDRSPDAKDQLQWKWSKGSATTKADFGSPTTTTSYHLCVYDGTSTVIVDALIPAGGLCGTSNPKPCWKDKTKGFDYKDKDLTPDGVEQLKLKEGLAAGKASIQLKAKGTPLDDPSYPITQPVTVQLHNTASGLCWEAVYSAPATKNTAGPPAQFKDKAD
ncbi:MAG: hypothetical protein IT294_17385 [Deltaproteobacteria bacterium]|nr:hypothetical protein [Deltaproteobacteria bacterium]